MKITDHIKNPAEIINQLIVSSFGKWWVGNCYISKDRRIFPGVKDLSFIAKPSRYENWLHGTRWGEFYYTPKRNLEVAGQLGDGEGFGDGSIIAVFPDFKKQALKYTSLYEDFFKKETEIIICSELDYNEKGKNCAFKFKEYSPSDKENGLTAIEGLEGKLIQSRAKNLGNAIKSLTINQEGILGLNRYLSEEQKRGEYSKVIECISLEEREILLEKLMGDLPYLKINEEKNPGLLKKYFERFNVPVESASDLELFQKFLLEYQITK